VRELPSIAPTPTVLILDDYHVADGSGDISYVTKTLIAKAPERLSVVICSRRVPEIPVGRLRAQGELAELRTRDLQFSEAEISDLFSSGLRESLDQESVGVLNRRSEGWAASLELIRTAVRDRSAQEVREFIRNLSGGQSELYDYLAEEVVGELGKDHQEFLMRTSLLLVVTVPSAAAICEISAAEATRLVEQSERLGLISRQGSTAAGYRYHPLVREFLTTRLRSAVGEEGVRSMHESAGRWAESTDWRAACYHFESAARPDAVHRVLDSRISVIAGQGGYELAADYLRRFKPRQTTASFEIIGSRVEYRQGRVESALRKADEAVARAPSSDAALNNAITMHANAGDHVGSWELAKRLADSASTDVYRTIARANCLRYEASLDGGIGALIEALEEIAAQSEAEDLSHFAGVSHLNLAVAELARGNVTGSFTNADLAVTALSDAYNSVELASAYLARASASAVSGHLDRARADIALARSAIPPSSRIEWLIEAADVEVGFGSADVAESLLREARELESTRSIHNLMQSVEVRLALRQGNLELAARLSDSFEVGAPTETPAFTCRQLALGAHVAVEQGSAKASSLVAGAARLAEKQGAVLWGQYCAILAALIQPAEGRALSVTIERTPADQLPMLDVFAEALVERLDQLSDSARECLEQQSGVHNERWIPALRRAVSDPASPSKWLAAEVLDQVGTAEDVPTLRALARSVRSSGTRIGLGRALARRLAKRYLIEDLGRVEVVCGEERVLATSVRRKVLAMLCFLLTKPRFSATRDEVIDALWPDLSPDVAVNSLNQTVYFLRRLFEPTYVDDLSPGYVHHGSDLLWLDPELVSSRSARCLAILDRLGGSHSEPHEINRLSEEYSDRFALDFAYEEWAVPFRTSLHVAYLRVVEAAVTRDMASGHHDRAIELARRAVERDPSVESLELALLRLYRTTGAHAAAAEQYEHYATVLREEFGVDPPPLASL
jgi:DNA-binding SARP family transcriptional activator